MKTTLVSIVAASGLLIHLFAGAAMAAGLTVSPSTITNDFNGRITLTITGLPAPGRTVFVERYADFDNDNVADAGEPIIQGFAVTDGQVPTLGGVRNVNTPGDEDGALNSQIRVELSFPGADATVDTMAGNFVFKVTDATPGGFAPATQPFTVRQKTRTQGVTGRVTAAGTGLPLANAFVVLIRPDGPGGVGTLANANGDFTIHSTPGDFVVAAIRPGYIVDPSTSFVTVSTNQFVTKNIALTSGTYTVSGRLVDAVSGDGVRGVFVFGDAEAGQIAVATADSAGHYSLQLPAGEWEIRPNQNQLALQGYVGFNERTTTNITGNVSNLNFALPKATALIYGRLTDDVGRPLSDVEMHADESDLRLECNGRSYPTNAEYALAVVAGRWWVNPEDDDPALQGFLVQGTNVTVSDGLAVRVDFALQRPTTRVGGRLVTDLGEPVSGIGVNICRQGQGGCFDTETDDDGRFVLGVVAGDWSVGFDSDDLAQRGLLAQSRSISVVDGVDQTNLLAVARATTAQIHVSIRETNGAPLGGIYIHGSAQISNSSYNVFGMSDGNGAAQLAVIDGQWEFSLGCWELGLGGFECAGNQVVTVAGSNVTVRFSVTPLPQPQRLQFSASTYTIGEQGSSAVITVVRTGPTTNAVTVDYAMNGGSATAGPDYTPAAGTLTFGAGMTERTFAVPIVNDMSPEAAETVGLLLSNATPGVSVGTPPAATLTIVDDDAAPGPNVTWYAVAKGQSFQQDSPAVPTTNGVTDPFEFVALVKESFFGSVTSAIVRAPGGVNHSLTPSVDLPSLDFAQGFPTKSALDAAYPGGSYLFTLGTFSDGSRTPSLSLGAESFPGAPRIANWAAAQAVDASAGFTVTWDPFSGGTSNDFVQLTIETDSGDGIYHSPDLAEADALNGTHTARLLPADTLEPGQTYRGRLLFVKRRSVDTNSYPTVPGFTMFYRMTKFSLRTAAVPPPQGRMEFEQATSTSSESAGLALFNVRRVGGSQGQVHVTVVITGGTATPAVDYGALSMGEPSSITLTFAEGETNVPVSLPMTDDSTFEPEETVLLALRNPTDGAVLGSLSNAVLRLLDNDPRPDSHPPSVTITAPANSAQLTNASFELRGTARDNFAVARVECQLENSGGTGDYESVTSANGWTNWTTTVAGLMPGTNIVRVRSWDDSDNPSAIASRIVVHLALSALTLATNGLGSITPGANGQRFPVGLSQTLTAVPGAGHVFSNWTGGLTSTAARLTFLMQSNLSLQANFVPNPFNRTKGAHNGLFHDRTNGVRHESSGFFTLRLTERGKYTGQLQLGGKRHAFLGQFDLHGQSASIVRRTGTNALRLELSLSPVGSPNDVTGRLINTNADWVAELQGDRAPTYATTNPSPFRGRYTLSIPWDEEAAGNVGGDGFGTVLVAPSGRLVFVGTLADATPTSQSAPVSKDGLWPWYAPLYGGQGSILGWTTLNTNPAPAASLTGTLNWIKPALPAARYYPGGFAFQSPVDGSIYLPPGTNAVLQFNPFGSVAFSGANLSGSFVNTVALGSHDRVINLTSSQPLAMTISIPTGLFQGAVTLTNDGQRVTRSFKGAVLQRQNFGTGFLPGTNQSGRVYFGPPNL